MKTKEWKDTEIGRIPKDWEVKPLGEVFETFPTPSYSRDQLSSDGEIRYLHYGDIHTRFGSVVDVSETKFPTISSQQARKYKSLCDGDVIMADASEDYEGCGHAIAVQNIGDTKLIAGLHTIPLRKKIEVFEGSYVGYMFAGSLVKKQIERQAVGTKVYSISYKSISDCFLVIPPPREQQRIAKALSDIDMLITSLDKAIEKKRMVKQGAMQQLLTGKKRLKGFTEGWKIKRIGDIGYTYNGLTGKSKGDFGVGTAHYVTFLNILNNPIIDTALLEKVNVALNEKQNEVRKGDLFFNTSSETPEEVGICATIDVDIDELYLNSFCFGFRLTDRDILSDYLAYYFRSSIGRQMMTMLAQGATRYNLSKDNFLKCRLLLPGSLVEQQAIIDVLSIMDGEISSITHEREKYLRLKEGMMQELLTGKTRLI